MAEMKTLTMARILIGIGGAATLLLVATVLAGYSLLGAEGVRVVHLSASLVAVLLVILAHSWVVVFLLASRRLLSGTDLEPGRDPLPSAGPRPHRVLPWPLAASLLVAASFVLRSGAVVGGLPGWVHAVVFGVTVAVQVVALGLELRALSANERRLDLADARLSAARE